MTTEGSPTIAVSGATGRAGAATLRALAQAGVEAIPLVRSASRAEELGTFGNGARVADFDDEESVVDALRGVDRLLLSSVHGPLMEAQQTAAVQAATRAGVRFVVKISASPASIFPATPAGIARAHLAVEEQLRRSAMDAVCVRPNGFMQVLLGFAQQIADGLVRLPLGEAKVSWVDVADVGRVAAKLLLEGAGPHSIVEVTGPRGLTFSEVVAVLSEDLGHDVRYVPLPDDEARAELVARGMSPWLVDHMLSIFALFRSRDAGVVTDAVPRFTGQRATDLSAFVRLNRERFVAGLTVPQGTELERA